MINKELIELQKGCAATCVVIPNDACNELDSSIVINSNLKDEDLSNVIKESKEDLSYFIINGIDEITVNLQEKFYQMVKDREFKGYKLSENSIIVLTVKDRQGLKNIAQELYQLCVVAF